MLSFDVMVGADIPHQRRRPRDQDQEQAPGEAMDCWMPMLLHFIFPPLPVGACKPVSPLFCKSSGIPVKGELRGFGPEGEATLLRSARNWSK